MEGDLPRSVIPAEAGIYVLECILDPRLRGNENFIFIARE
jgi:hypothetical protein